MRNSLFEEKKLRPEDWVEHQAVKLQLSQPLYRPYCEHELREVIKERAKDHKDKGLHALDEALHIEPAFRKLRRQGLLNDCRIVESAARESENKGDEFITLPLKNRGIAEGTIKRGLSIIPPENLRALKETKKWMALAMNQHKAITATDIANFLTGRHFSSESITRTLEAIQPSADKTPARDPTRFTAGHFSSRHRLDVGEAEAKDLLEEATLKV